MPEFFIKEKMNRYIVAYSYPNDSEIFQQEIYSTSKRDAAVKYLSEFQDIIFEENQLLDMEDFDLLAEHCWDYLEVSISVLQID